MTIPLDPGTAPGTVSMSREVRFAIEHGTGPVELILELPAERAADPPLLTLVEEGSGREFQLTGTSNDGRWGYRIPVEPSHQPTADDELRFVGRYEAGDGRRDMTVVVRRTNCRISTALVERRHGSPLSRQTRAALLWYAWNRYREVCGLKRFTSGLSGSDVFVFRPRLPDLSDTPDLPDPTWGSCLLVKTGKAASLEEEWERYSQRLVGRLHPFMARSEALLDTRPSEPGQEDRDRVTLIGSFLGGELLQVESFEALVRGTADACRCRAVLDKLASVLATWHAGSGIRPLVAWDRVYRGIGGGPGGSAALSPRLRRGSDGDWFDFPSPVVGKLRLFDRYDLDSESDRRAYSGGVAWDTHFHSGDHLSRHLLGKGDKRDGLLYRLMALPVLFSLTHGDLHPRNVLVGRDDVWLLDFGEAGQGPALYDYAKLEVYLRLWCLDLRPTSGDFDEAATRFEELLLDHMTGSEGSVEPASELADPLGARPQDLLKLASCVGRIRHQAAGAGTGCPDRRDYLAVLYLTVLDTLRYAGKEPELAENFRLLVALGWVLEDMLSRIVGLTPFQRPRAPFDPRALVTARWLAAPGAPARVRYVLDREDGRRALAPLAATRGVLQNPSHHLDVLDHTLLVLANLEVVVHAEDPLAALFDPRRVERQAERNLRDQGISLPGLWGSDPAPVDPGAGPDVAIWEHARTLIRGWLDDNAKLVLKWAALLHDVGKPATRSLNEDGKKGRRIQFIGHELYGLQLVTGHLELYFPDREQRARVTNLILNHHAHHQWVTDFRKPEKQGTRDAMTSGRHVAEVRLDELERLCKLWETDVNPHAKDFLALLFHGFADTLAGRGPEMPTPVAEVAEIDRAVLRFYTLYMLARDEQAVRFDHLLSQLHAAGVTPKPGLAGRLRPWFLHETYARKAAGKPELTAGEFSKKAKQING
jgi:hypothetical protein